MDELIQNFFDAGIRINSKSKTKVTVENHVFEAGEFYTTFLKEVPFFKEYILKEGIWEWSDKDKAQWVLKFWGAYFAENRKRVSSASDAFDGSAINTGDFELVANFHTGDKVVYNSKIRVISKMHPNTFLAAMGKNQRSTITEIGVRVATFSFNPYNDFDRRITQLEGQEVVEFNCFHAPAWRCTDGSKIVDLSLEKQYEEVDPPEEFIQFMEHLFPKKDQRQFVYMWMYHAIFSRNETYLCLNGKKGAGKNFLVQLLSHLVGRDYFKDINRRVFEVGFNAVLDRARLIQLDEIKADTDDKIDILKKYINKDQNIEKKGVDADQLSETFNSFIVNNNNITDWKVEWDDRRFSFADLTGKTLRSIWSQEKIDEMFERLTDIEFQRQVGFFIFREGPKYDGDQFTVLKGERFWKIVYNSLAEWERGILDLALLGETKSITVTDLRLDYRKRLDGGKMFPIRVQKVRDFVEGYRHRGEHAIGEVIGEGENAEIVFSDHFYKGAAVESSSPLDKEYGFPDEPDTGTFTKRFNTVL